MGPDLGPNCLQRSSADDKLPLAKKEKELNELSCDNTNSFIYVHNNNASAQPVDLDLSILMKPADQDLH